MTEIAVRAAGIPEKIQYAKVLAESGLLPAQYRKQPGNVMYAVEYGEMLGLSPMAAITGVHVIEGKPSASSGLISALVRRAGHRLRVSGNDSKAIAEIVRADDPDFVYRVEWTIARARTAGLVNKDVWKKYPAAMLKARAITEVARDACEEALMGMRYTPEELDVEVDDDGQPLPRKATVVATPADPDWASRSASAHERATGHPEVDWDVEIAQAVADANADRLRELWRLTTKADLAIRERITAAIEQIKAGPERGEDEPVDAEVVEDSPDPEPEQPTEGDAAVVADFWADQADAADAEQ